MNAPLPSDHFDGNGTAGPRFREAGEMVLDRFHRDARVDDRWLGLSDREFALLWRLAARPGERLDEGRLRDEAWPVAFAPAPASVTPHFARMRAKLAAAGVGHLICTDGDGRHFLAAPPDPGLSRLWTGCGQSANLGG